MDESSSPDPSSPDPDDHGRTRRRSEPIIGPDFLPPLSPPQTPRAASPDGAHVPARASAALGALVLALAVITGVGLGLAATQPAGSPDHHVGQTSGLLIIDPSARSERAADTAGPPGGVAGRAYAADEPTSTVTDPGDRLGFDFRVPEGWGCTALDDQPPGVAAWRCLDAASRGPGLAPTGGVVRATDCASTCDPAEWHRMRETGTRPAVPWEPVDEQTMYAENPVDSFRAGQVTMMLSRLYGKSETSDRHLSVVLHGPVDDSDQLQKLVNELWERSG